MPNWGLLLAPASEPHVGKGLKALPPLQVVSRHNLLAVVVHAVQVEEQGSFPTSTCIPALGQKVPDALSDPGSWGGGTVTHNLFSSTIYTFHCHTVKKNVD